MSQSIDECGLLGSKPIAFPIETNHKLALASGKCLKDPTQYCHLVGRLIYLTITRFELFYAVYILAQFMRDPKEEHMEAAHRVLRYLKRNPRKGIFYAITQNYKLLPTVILIGGHALLLDVPSQATLSLLEALLLHGKSRSKRQYLVRLQRQNIVQWP